MSELTQVLELLSTHRSIGILGEAGTGKTTLCINVVQALVPNLHGISMIRKQPHLPFMFCSFTNAAVARIKRRVPSDWPCYTIHKALEYKPDMYSMNEDIFSPSKCEIDPLRGMQLVVVDEVGMVNEDLGSALIRALPSGCKIIFTGDPNQLRPVFGTSLLRHLQEADSVPLLLLKTQYRQTTGLLKLAHTILAGKTPSPNVDEGIRILKADGIQDSRTGFDKVCDLLDKEDFQAGRDILLCPFRTPDRWQSTHHYGKYIADKMNPNPHLYEILPVDGLYVASGDLILYRKEEYRVLELERNPHYTGDAPATPGTMNRYGHKRRIEGDPLWWADAKAPSDLAWSQELAYRITCESTVTGEIEVIERIPRQDNNDHLILGGATTIHKAQGNEWERVFLLTLAIHTGMCTRPLLYTAVTRAQKELLWITARAPLVRGPRRKERTTPIPRDNVIPLEAAS